MTAVNSDIMQILGRISATTDCIKEDVGELKEGLSTMATRQNHHELRLTALEIKHASASSRWRLLLENVAQVLNALVLAYLLFRLGIH